MWKGTFSQTTPPEFYNCRIKTPDGRNKLCRFHWQHKIRWTKHTPTELSLKKPEWKSSIEEMVGDVVVIDVGFEFSVEFWRIGWNSQQAIYIHQSPYFSLDCNKWTLVNNDGSMAQLERKPLFEYLFLDVIADIISDYFFTNNECDAKSGEENWTDPFPTQIVCAFSQNKLIDEEKIVERSLIQKWIENVQCSKPNEEGELESVELEYVQIIIHPKLKCSTHLSTSGFVVNRVKYPQMPEPISATEILLQGNRSVFHNLLFVVRKRAPTCLFFCEEGFHLVDLKEY